MSIDAGWSAPSSIQLLLKRQINGIYRRSRVRKSNAGPEGPAFSKSYYVAEA
jgi:hypothetical protein